MTGCESLSDSLVLFNSVFDPAALVFKQPDLLSSWYLQMKAFKLE